MLCLAVLTNDGQHMFSPGRRRCIKVVYILVASVIAVTSATCFVMNDIIFGNIRRRKYGQNSQQDHQFGIPTKQVVARTFLSANEDERISNVVESQSKQQLSEVEHNINNIDGGRLSRRRLMAQAVKTATFLSPASLLQHPTNAAAAITAATTTTSQATTRPEDATITHKVIFKVRISRADGSFYDKNEVIDPIDSENQVFTGQLIVGLFGKYAPTNVARFLSYVTSPEGGTAFDENPYPNYSRSAFTKFDELTGIVTAGVIPKLESIELNGSNVLKYGTRLIPATLWIDKISTEQRIRHIGKGLLTHKLLDPSPQFGITTRSDTTMLDTTNVVFGRILMDDSSNEFLSRIVTIPTYSVERTASFADDNDESLAQEAASVIFNAQREFFRGAAKSFGDDRISKLYDGKFLRRIEVTQVTVA
jgi:Cyclophilin type peptidyl-prolyl cis-trans isomerase/CLD